MLSYDVPEGVDSLLADGDSVVPRASAIPIELSEEYYDTFVPERHGSLQAKTAMLDELYERLKQMQTRNLRDVHGSEPQPKAAAQPAISLELDDLYVQGSEPVEIHACLVNLPQPQGVLEAEIQGAGTGSFPPTKRTFQQDAPIEDGG